MKPQKSKKQLREELAKLTESYLSSGGAVEEVPRGKSGNEKNNNLFKQITSFTPKVERTPLTALVKSLEERKQQGRAGNAQKPKTRRNPRKRLIVDDFGDPIRWVWDDQE